MTHQGWDAQLSAYGDGHWRATFYTTGMAQLHRRRLGVGAGAVAGGARAAWETLTSSR